MRKPALQIPRSGALGRIPAALLLLGTAAALCGSARAGLIVGVNDAAALDPAEVHWFYPTLGFEGLQVSTLQLRWDDTAPAAVPDEQTVSTAIAQAQANGVTVELDLYPLHSQVFTGGVACAPSSDPQGCGNSGELEAFAAWTAAVASAFPTVHEYVVMNECNQPLFVNPQWDSSGANQSAEICGRALAGAYDALKAVSSENVVWGLGLSPRGNDNPHAPSDSSTSPVAFLRDIGAWFKAFAAATGRSAPLMDGFDFHPYPIPQSQPFAQGYQNPNDASVSNLPRVYQAFYDGFNGSAQPTIGQQAGGGLPVSLNEVGIQTDSSGHAGYVGSEVSANANGGVLGSTASESYQAAWYVEMLDLIACDPNVRFVNIYHLLDEADLAGWQSGLFYIDRSPKLSALAVHDWIANGGGVCQGAPHPWTPNGVPPAPAPAPVPVPAAPSAERILVTAAGRIRIFDGSSHLLLRTLAPFGTAYRGPLSIALATSRGTSEIAVGEGPGGRPLVKLLTASGRQLAALEPFADSFRGGVSVCFAALNGEAAPELVVGSGPGMAAQVKVYSAGGARLLAELTPFPRGSRGGVSLAAGNLGGSANADLVVGSGPGSPAQVIVYAADLHGVVESLSPFASDFTGGVSVAAADLDGDGSADLIVASRAGRVTVVKAYRDATRIRLWSVDAFAPFFSGGASVASLPSSARRLASVVVGAGAGGGSQVKILDGSSGAFVASFLGASGSGAVGVAAG